MLLLAMLTVSLCFSQATNDTCATAETLTISETKLNINFDINSANIASEVGCAGTDAQDYADLWYSFTMPVTGNLFIDGDVSWNNFTLYDACNGTEIMCGNSSLLAQDLAANATFVLRVYRTSNYASNSVYQNFSIQAFQEASNDTCDTEDYLDVTTTMQTVNFKPGSSSITSVENCSDVAGDYATMWYNFTMPVNGNLILNGATSWNKFALFDACDGTRIACDETYMLVENLVAGTAYKLLLYRSEDVAYNGIYESFTVQAHENVANDTCATAEPLALTTDKSTVAFNVGGANIENTPNCSGDINEYADIWYSFTMPVSGNIYIDGTISWNKYELYDVCGGAQLFCGESRVLIENLSAGTEYKLRLYRAKNVAINANYSSFTIQAYEAPVNQSCETAGNINVTTESATVAFDTGGLTVVNRVGCDSDTEAEYGDLWYNFTMPVSGNLYVNGTIVWNQFALFDACNGTQLECDNSSMLAQNLTAGTSYKLRLSRSKTYLTNDSYKSFTIQAFEDATNDTCATAETLTVTTESTTVPFEIGGATMSDQYNCADDNENDYGNIWYTFTMPVTGNVYINGSLNWNKFALYNTCEGTEISCDVSNMLVEGLTAGNSYTLRVSRTKAYLNSSSYKSFTIQAFPVVDNDICATAETISVSNEPNTVNFQLAGAEISNEVGCADTEAEDYADVWYKFTMPSNGNVTIDGSLSWNKFQLYTSCDSSEIQCGEGSVVFDNLSENTEYLLRVFRTESLAQNLSYTSFNIEIEDIGLSVNTSEALNALQLYPNPTSSTINIASEIQIDAVEIFNTLGQSVLKTKNQNNIKINHLNTGLYLVKIQANQKETIKRIVIK